MCKWDIVTCPGQGLSLRWTVSCSKHHSSPLPADVRSRCSVSHIRQTNRHSASCTRTCCSACCSNRERSRFPVTSCNWQWRTMFCSSGRWNYSCSDQVISLNRCFCLLQAPLSKIISPVLGFSLCYTFSVGEREKNRK